MALLCTYFSLLFGLSTDDQPVVFDVDVYILSTHAGNLGEDVDFVLQMKCFVGSLFHSAKAPKWRDLLLDLGHQSWAYRGRGR